MAYQDDPSDDASTDTSSNGGASSDAASSDSTSDASSNDGSTSDTASSDSTSSDDSTSVSSFGDSSSSDGASSNGASSNGVSSSSSDGAAPLDASSSSSPATDSKASVPIPSGINANLTSADQATMLSALGNPGTPDPNCGAVAPALQKLMKTASVGPFNVTGLSAAVDALARVFAAVQSAKPDLYAVLGTAGMLCVRYVRGSTTNFSNHSWGTAIDMTIGGVLTPRGSTTVTQGLVDLAPFMAAERFFWGAGFSPTPDGMHFEASHELITDWKSNGTIP